MQHSFSITCIFIMKSVTLFLPMYILNRYLTHLNLANGWKKNHLKYTTTFLRAKLVDIVSSDYTSIDQVTLLAFTA